MKTYEDLGECFLQSANIAQNGEFSPCFPAPKCWAGFVPAASDSEDLGFVVHELMSLLLMIGRAVRRTV